MNHIYQLHEDQHIFRLTDGAEHHPREEGIFEVRNSHEVATSFSTLLGAFMFYLRLDEPATLWDITEESILIERKLLLIAPGAASICSKN